MSAATEEHGHGIPDELIVVGYGGAMLVLVVVGIGLAMLAKFWNLQAEPDMRQVEPPPVVETHH